MTTVRRIGSVSAVIEGSTALVTGYGAWFLHYLLSEELPGGIESVMVRRRLSENARLHVRHAAAALEEAAAAFVSMPRAASPAGNGETEQRTIDASSEAWIGTRQAASLLGRSPRRVRQYVEGGDLKFSRLRGGRLEVLRTEVVALGERLHGRAA